MLALLIMTLGSVVMIYPYAYMVGASLKTRNEFTRDKVSIIPPRFQIGQRLAHVTKISKLSRHPGTRWPHGCSTGPYIQTRT